MPDRSEKYQSYSLRAALPRYIGLLAVGALAVAVLIVAVGFYRERSKGAFRLKGEHTQLSTDVVAEVNNYERLETENGVSKYYIKADHARTFSDDHQEFDNVFVQVFGEDGVAKDEMASESALYIPEKDKNFTVYLKGNVNLASRDGLKLKTEHVVYTRSTETAELDEALQFERGTIRGKAFGATANLKDRKLELLRDVQIEAFESPELAASNIRYASLSSGSASFDDLADTIQLNGGLNVELLSNAAEGSQRKTEIRADRGVVLLTNGNAGNRSIKVLELFNSVNIRSLEGSGQATILEAAYAKYDKPADRYELKGGSHIVAGQGTDIRAVNATFEAGAHKLALNGGVEVTQGSELIKGDDLYADLFPDNRIRNAVVRGNALARQTTTERTATVAAPELNVAYNDARQLQDANAVGSSSAEIVPVGANAEYSIIAVNAAGGIGMSFQGAGLINKIRSDGRTSIDIKAPSNAANAANKRLEADTVRASFNANGKDMSTAEAVGNAVLHIEPLAASAENYRTTINAPRFDCEFFQTGNQVRSCTAARKTRTVRVPTAASNGRGTQTLTADRLTATFLAQSGDVEQITATHGAKFNELDRNGIATEMTFTSADGVVRLRGDEPTVWDDRARARAREIDWDTRNRRSSLRGSVSTTYYNRKQTGNSVPFGDSEKPVYLTAEAADIDHAAETAVYSRNARGWQENNYIRGDRIVIEQARGRMSAEGHVQSMLHNARLRQGGRGSAVPLSAASGSFLYDRDNALLRYSNSVDIRQGTDRITADRADIFLNQANEVSRTIAEANVRITQPNRRASGDWVQYTADDDIAILRGSPATIVDAQNGSSQSPELTFYLRDNRLISEGRSRQGGSGRTRSVYKVNPAQ